MDNKRDLELWISSLLRYGVLLSAAIVIVGWALAYYSTWVSLGILLLIWLPVARVALSILLFILQKDYVYVFLSTTVLMVLIGGAFLGFALRH